ncbi:unnamed protein product [Chrysoparadoxa australica]
MSIKDGWFRELAVMWPGQRFCLEVEKVLLQERSQFQDVLVFESTNYGKVLVLDGVIQLTERDEFAYQEMLSHIPCFAHGKPRKALIVGGGDGGVLRELARHDSLEQIDMCEIDPMVCEVTKKFEFTTATAFDDPRLNLVHEDAAEFVSRHDSLYDVIIVDSSDPVRMSLVSLLGATVESPDGLSPVLPLSFLILTSLLPGCAKVGPAETLYQPQFYENMKRVLAPGGVIATQGECLWLHLPLIKTVLGACTDIFHTVDYAFTTIPTYPSGQIGFVLVSNTERDLSKPAATPPDELAKKLRYYTPEVHRSAFVLPAFAEREIAPVRRRHSKEEGCIIC